jgi:uncharacterized protein with HEPN domain
VSDKDDALYLDHIGESIDRIGEYVAGGRESFLAPGIVQDAVLRRLHTLAESAQHLSAEIKAHYFGENGRWWRGPRGEPGNGPAHRCCEAAG